jgi:pimeloyl-ACP methyl ester carboxylesterase
MSEPGVRRSRFRAGGAEPRLIEAGDPKAPEAVVFLHGNPGSADDWAALVEAVGRSGRRAVAFDLPDFGETAAAPEFVHTTEAHARFVGEALAVLGIERADLVLHDFGGPIGLAWAGESPERVLSVALFDTGVLPGYRWHSLARLWRTPVVGEAFMAIATRGGFRRLLSRREPRGLPRDFVETMYDHYDARTKRAVLALYRATDDPGAAGDRFVAAISGRDLPALVVWGEHDPYLPAGYAARQREAFPSAEVHVLVSSGHFPHADSPDRVERLLLEFLARRAAPVGS